MNTTQSERLSVGDGEKMKRIRDTPDELVADEIHVSDAFSKTRDRAYRVAEISGGAATFLVMGLGFSSSFEDVIDGRAARKLIIRIQLFILLLNC